MIIDIVIRLNVYDLFNNRFHVQPKVFGSKKLTFQPKIDIATISVMRPTNHAATQ